MRKVKGKWIEKVRTAPREGTHTRELYDALMAGQEVLVNCDHRSHTNDLNYLRDFYNLETRCVGGGKYIRYS